MAKKEAREVLELELGRLSYQIGKQAQAVNRENEILKSLQRKANEIATKIEKLDG